MAKLPSLQWYPGDWKKDAGIRALNFHDRGVWFEMLMLMFEADPRGYLMLNGHAMTDEMIAQALGLDNQILTSTLTKLLTYGVASREPKSGAIYCRRMVRDEELRKMRQSVGKLGGNPVLVNQNSTTQVNQNSTPSSSSSSSDNKKIARSEKPKRAIANVDNEYLASLKTNQAYQGIDIDREYGKALAWLSANPGRRMTRPFFIGWLNRCNPAQKELLPANKTNTRGEIAPPGMKWCPFAETWVPEHQPDVAY